MIPIGAMVRRTSERLASLAADIASPRVVPAIDKALEEARQEYLDLFDLRKMAVRRHGETSPPPPPPFEAPEFAADEDSGPKDPKGNQQATNLNVQSLSIHYQTDDRSSYKKLRFRTRTHYDGLLRRIVAECGEKKLIDLKAADIQSLHKVWTDSGDAMAHALIGMLRTLFNYGATVLEDSECDRLSATLHRMRFPVAKSRSESLTADQVMAIRAKAREMGFPSIALAQSLQFECRLGQRDVIGEWIPQGEPGDSDVRESGLKWLRGLRWSEIGKDFVLRHVASRGGKMLELPLAEFPMVKEELARFADKQGTSGPMIISESTNLPYLGWQFRHQWRLVARAAGVPDNVKNMDSRAKATNTSDALGANGHTKPQGEWTTFLKL